MLFNTNSLELKCCALLVINIFWSLLGFCFDATIAPSSIEDKIISFGDLKTLCEVITANPNFTSTNTVYFNDENHTLENFKLEILGVDLALLPLSYTKKTILTVKENAVFSIKQGTLNISNLNIILEQRTEESSAIITLENNSSLALINCTFSGYSRKSFIRSYSSESLTIMCSKFINSTFGDIFISHSKGKVIIKECILFNISYKSKAPFQINANFISIENVDIYNCIIIKHFLVYFQDQSFTGTLLIDNLNFSDNYCKDQLSPCFFLYFNSTEDNCLCEVNLNRVTFLRNLLIIILQTEAKCIDIILVSNSNLELDSNIDYKSFMGFKKIEFMNISNVSVSMINGVNSIFFDIAFILTSSIVDLYVTNFIMKNWKCIGNFGIILVYGFNDVIRASKIVFQNVKFINNIVLGSDFKQGGEINQGGAISITGTLPNELNITMKNVFFIQNQLYRNGFAILLVSSSDDSIITGKILLQNLLFEQNEVKKNAKLIYLNSQEVILEKSLFLRNYGETTSMFQLTNYQSISLNTSLFYNNYFQTFRGAFILLSSKHRDHCSILITEFTMWLNRGKFSNIYISSHFNFTLNLMNSQFNNNTSQVQGAVLYLDFRGKLESHKVIINKCIFVNNKASLGGVAKFGNLGGNISIKYCIFINCMAENSGGCVFINTEKSTSIYLDHNIFSNSTAKKSGAVLFLLLGKVFESNCIFSFNFAERGSSYIIGSYAELDMDNSLISNNLHQATGISVINSQGKSSTLIRRTVFTNNLSKLKGVVLAVYGFARVNLLFYKNQIELTYFFQIFTLKLQFNDSIFFNDNAILYSSNSATTISGFDSLITECESYSSLIYLHYANASFYKLKLNRNKGPIFKVSFATLLLESSVIAENKFEDCYDSSLNRIGYLVKLDQTNAVFSQSQILNIKCKFIQDALIISKGNNISFFHMKFENISSNSSMSLLYATNVNVTLVNFSAITCSNTFFKLQSSNAYINSSIFVGKTSDTTLLSSFEILSAIKFINCLTIFVDDSKFIGFDETAIYLFIEGDFDYSITSPFNFKATNCLFLNNRNSDQNSIGSGINVINFNAELENCTFQENKAGFGAGIFFLCNMNSTSMCVWSLKDCKFKNNEALSRGAGFFWSGKAPVEIKNEYESNKAIDSPDKASFQERLEFDHTTLEYNEILKRFSNYLSGVPLNISIKLCMKDHYNQTVTELTSNLNKKISTVKLSKNERDSLSIATDRAFIKDSTSSTFENGLFIYKEMMLTALPGNAYKLVFDSPLLALQIQHVVQRELTLPVYFVECSLGYVFDTISRTCKYCMKGEFSLSTKDSSCRVCPTHGICEGGTIINVENGFWRSSIMSWNVIPCEYPTACKGGYQSECGRGWEGPLCGACSENFFMNSEECAACQNVILSLVPFILFFFLIILYQWITIRLKMQVKDFTQSVFLKIFLNYLKLTGVIKASNDWPWGLGDYLKFQNSVGDPSRVLFSLDCILMHVAGPKINVFYKRLFFISALSLLYPTIVYFYFKLRNRFCPGRNETFDLKYKFTLSLLVIILSLQSFFLNTFFSALTCVKIEGELFLKERPTIKCWSDEHTFTVNILSVPFIIIWIVIIPLLMMYTLFRNRRKLRSHGVHMKDGILSKRSSILDGQAIEKAFAFLTDGYQEQYYFWEFVFLFQNVCVIFINSFIYQEILQTYLFCTLFFIFLAIQVKIEPYHNALLNKTQLYSSLCCFISFCLLSIMTTSFPGSLLRPALVVCIFIANCLFLIHWTANFLILKKESMKKLFTFIGKFTMISKRDKKAWLFSLRKKANKRKSSAGVKSISDTRKPVNEIVSFNLEGEEK